MTNKKLTYDASIQTKSKLTNPKHPMYRVDGILVIVLDARFVVPHSLLYLLYDAVMFIII